MLFIHDEVILEVPVGQIHEAAQRVEEIMRDVEAEWLPDLPPEAEAKASLIWSKDAERVVDADGRLQIWTPGNVDHRKGLTKLVNGARPVGVETHR